MNRSTTSRSRGFSLVEILIAVLILALGLLGLGAVFPAVIAQQRDAVDSTRSAATTKTAAATLRGASEWTGGFNGVETGIPAAERQSLKPWDVLGLDRHFGKRREQAPGPDPTVPGGSLRPTSYWQASWSWHDGQLGSHGDSTLAFLGSYRDSGLITFNGQREDPDSPGNFRYIRSDRNGARLDTRIPELARLSPPAFSGRDPQYVWDFVARRHPATNQIEVALFVRRIDPRIRTSRDVTLSDVLALDGVFAVGVDGDGRPAPGDNAVAYAVPLALGIEVPDLGDGPILDRVRFVSNLGTTIVPAFDGADPTGFDTRVELASLEGQKLVDNFGIVRTVVEVVESEDDMVVISPPFTLQQAIGGIPVGGVGGAPLNTIDPTLAQQVVFTPQIPVSIEVFSVE